MRDVIIIGLGVMGSAAAHRLALQGCRVLGIDQYAPPHTHGSSHGLSRIYRQAYFEDSRYVPLLLRAFELWQELEAATSQRLLHLTGSLVIGPDSGVLVRRSAESARAFNLPSERLTAAEVQRRFPAFHVQPHTTALLEHNAGYLDAEASVRAQLAEAARAGAELRVEERVLDWKADAGGVTVRTTAGTYSAAHLVITAGPWAPEILAGLGLPLRVTRQVLYWFEPQDAIELYGKDRMPVYLFEAENNQPLVYGFPWTGTAEEGVKVAVHGSDDVCTPESVDREIRPRDEQYIRAQLARTLPRLAGRLLHAETCLYTMTPDEHFILDAHPEHANVTLAAGFSGHGFKFAPVIGEALAQLVTAGASPFDLRLFNIDRFQAVQAVTR